MSVPSYRQDESVAQVAEEAVQALGDEELLALGVDAAQGFVFAVPQTAEELAEGIRARQRWC
jgi:EAL domain-containing protein (putative c-di-GMP-specific phosphodiesterase class I)